MQIDPRLAEQLRLAPDLLETHADEAVAVYKPAQLPLWRCLAHGQFRAGSGICPSGCSGQLVRPIGRDGAPGARGVWRDARGRERDGLGRFLPIREADRVVMVLSPDEAMSEPEVRQRLRAVLPTLPSGSKKPFARLIYRGPWALNTLRQVAKGRGLLLEACRRRLSRVLYQLERGELIWSNRTWTAGAKIS